MTLQKKTGVSILFLAVILACRSGLNNHQGSKPVWEENFDQLNSFDTTRWSKIPRGESDWNRHMSDFDSCYAMRNGKLVLRGINNATVSSDTSKYLTGGVYTKDKVSFGFGRLEIRAKLNSATGAWPAFWLLGQGRKYPGGGEIDIMEHLNYDSIVYQTVHSHYTIDLNIKDNPKHGGTAPIDPDGFNTYAVEKYRDSVVFFVNDKRTFSYPRISTDEAEQFPYADGEHYLLLDMQLGGEWVGEVDPADLPVEMEIDWVRFYAFK
ncbi:glycoside hydrolase family 16 protein [Sinomicrobium weinanense]|uniref:Glycoside hydrolase family 16 protein n=1 Tax=Sinomicrobium weinanense TaxID=2842200 RepID=A0A926Q5P2_9FLAO|nr:glycoside hydrolase family 16 protein [Sinomicrobium weinanense]MBC9798371.1 glycoside hydrolase family 16 protein [Sinomicrobium weinanense]MBU3125346.1 glycoside hydrolase family 16 protein [Sinomicrobium weinanense]